VIILDTNVFIYLSNGMLDRNVIAEKDVSHASITKVETLGFSSIPVNELLLLEALFDESYGLPLTDSIIDRAIRLRQAKRMSLGDSIIAASALEHGLTFWTANVKDFSHISGLDIFNPLTKPQ
jgi:predicted nucleic acid-binding protein